MPDVSRVEYDAALKRVEVRARARGLRLHEASLADLTLAALGLDEPPTEDESVEAKLRDLIATLWLYVGRYEWTQLTTEQKELFADVIDQWHVDEYDGADAEPIERWWRDAAVVPRSEPPKACPTCFGRGRLIVPGRVVGSRVIGCAVCNGTGHRRRNSMTTEQRETAINIMSLAFWGEQEGDESTERALDALTEEFLLLHRDDVTEERVHVGPLDDRHVEYRYVGPWTTQETP